jgi:ligand-binding SRPBCC domain-containing protein
VAPVTRLSRKPCDSMTTIRATTIIDAPIEVCFQLSLSIDLELSAARQYEIKAVGGVTKGSIGLGERVTWKSRHFGIWVIHTSEITRLEPPSYFQDSMVRGLFHSFKHDHFFRSVNSHRTEMHDELHFCLPAYLLGVITEQLLVMPRLTDLLMARNALIKKNAESSAVELNEKRTSC